MAMGRETWWALFLLLFLVFVDEIHGSRRQEQALRNLNKAKFWGGSVDRSSKTILEVDNKAVFGDHDYDKSPYYYDQQGLKDVDRIERLPGQPEGVSLSQYGGYVTVDKVAGRAFYYYFVEAQQSHHTHKLPLLLWLNGGPGCSSLAYGAMQEVGPFRVNSDGKTLHANKYSWNYAANVLFLESPAGVGFSYSNKTSDYNSNGDRKTASDNYVFLRNWLERFPEYKTSDFYIAGESYSGHYVPQLAHTILHHNNHPNSTFFINLKGILIGNAAINDETDNRGIWDYLASHAIISDKAAHDMNKYCNFSDVASIKSKECLKAFEETGNDIAFIDVYNIYAPRCLDSNLITSLPKPYSEVIDPCSDRYVYAYMNRAEAQEALHANVTKLTHDWQLCTSFNWTDAPSTILPLLQEFLNHGLRLWIISGDVDGVVPVTATKYSIEKLNLTVKTAWHPWFVNREVGGYSEIYKEGLTFATVRGAGHEVPSYQPARALALVAHFLKGIPLPNTNTTTF